MFGLHSEHGTDAAMSVTDQGRYQATRHLYRSIRATASLGNAALPVNYG